MIHLLRDLHALRPKTVVAHYMLVRLAVPSGGGSQHHMYTRACATQVIGSDEQASTLDRTLKAVLADQEMRGTTLESCLSYKQALYKNRAGTLQASLNFGGV